MYKKHNITYKSAGYGRVAGYTGHGGYAYGGIFMCFSGNDDDDDMIMLQQH